MSIFNTPIIFLLLSCIGTEIMLFEAFQTLSGRCKSIPCNQWNCTEEKEDNFNEDHYDLEDRNGIKLREADNNLFQIPARFVVKDINDSKLMYTRAKLSLYERSSHCMTMLTNFLELWRISCPSWKGTSTELKEMESISCESLAISQGSTIRWKSMESKSPLFIRIGSQCEIK